MMCTIFLLVKQLILYTCIVVAAIVILQFNSLQVVEDVVDIIDDVQVWPDEVTADTSSL